MNTDFIIGEINKITEHWTLPDWAKFRSFDDYWIVKDGYHKRWFNKGEWHQSAYNSWLIWKFEKLKKYNDMSFAEDFGHDIPDDYESFRSELEDGYYYSGISSKNRIRTFNNVIKEVTTDKAFLIKFEDGNKVWVPKSKVTFEGDSIEIPNWLVKNFKFL